MSVTARPDSLEASPAPPAKSDFGDVTGEFHALLSNAGVYDLSPRAQISLTGSDRTRWLNGMVTNNIRDLAPGHGVYAFLLNPQGHILGDLFAYNRGESLRIDTDQAQLEKILAAFDKYIIMDDVEVANLTSQQAGIGIAGPKSSEALRAAGLDLPDLKPLQFAEVTWQQSGITIIRGDNPCVEAFELWLAPGNAESVRRALINAGAAPVGTTALDLFRIASGIPSYGIDIRERDLPQETEQDRALNFSKGCYVGQEIVERIRSRGQVRRKFTGFQVHGQLPAPGSKIQVEGKEVGEITSAASLPLPKGDLNVALGYIRREAATPGKAFEAGGSPATVATLPFAEIFK